jgi:hypothetical protein
LTKVTTWCSILVIISVSVFSEYSWLAALIATAPTGTPLSTWVFVQQHPHNKNAALKDYTYNVVKGVSATLAFAIACHMAARADMGIWRALASGYATWLCVYLVLARI